MSQIDPAQKFPLMTPVKSPPPLFKLNGCGVGLYGRRDVDPQTGADVATWCLSLAFIPCFALRAYRVAKAQRGWYFLGQEPLSILAKVWNAMVVSAIIVAVGAGLRSLHGLARL